MADETKKIILQITVDQGKAITEIVNLKDRVRSLKEEQKALDLTTLEGRKANEAYNASIKALTKEQRSLELAVEKTAAGFEYESGSIAANRAELSKLTAEYKNLANPSKEQTARIKELSDRLKEQEGAIGNTSRNVGNYKEALLGIQSQLGAFGPQVQQLTAGFNGVNQGLKLVSGGFTTLKGAIITSGIGVLVILLAELVSYFKNTDEGATKLEGVFGAIGAVTKEVSGFIAEMGSNLADLATGAISLEDILSNLGDFIQNEFSIRIKSFGVLSDAVSSLLKGDFTTAAKKATDGYLQFAFGIENATDKVKDYALQLAKVAEEAFQYAVKLDAINDAQRDLDVTNARSNKIVQELIITAKNKTKTDQERIDLLLKANKIEEESVLKQSSLDKQRLALIVERNNREKSAINQKLERDILEAKSETKKIELRQKALSISDKLAQEQADLEKKIIDAETSFIQLREKNQNKIDVLEQQIAAHRQKAYEAYVKQLQEVNALAISLENARQARVISNLDYELSKTDLNTQQRLALLTIRGEEEKALQKKILDEKLAQLTTASLQENANQQAIELEKLALIEEGKQKLIDIEKKTADEIAAVNLAAEKKQTEDAKKEQEQRKKDRDQFYNDAKNVVNEAAQFATNVNQISLQNNLRNNEKARKDALASSSKDKDTQAKINAKYDKLADEEQKKAARKDLSIKEIQVLANAALSISQALASSPPPASFVLAGLAAVAAAAQVTALEGQKSKLADGGLLNGPSHSQGGIKGTGRFGNIEVEGGEYVVNKRSTKQFLPLLNKINYSPNRAPIKYGKMATGGQIYDGGYAARRSNENAIVDLNLKNILAETIANMPAPQVLVKDINNGINRVANVKEMANVTK